MKQNVGVFILPKTTLEGRNVWIFRDFLLTGKEYFKFVKILRILEFYFDIYAT